MFLIVLRVFGIPFHLDSSDIFHNKYQLPSNNKHLTMDHLLQDIPNEDQAYKNPKHVPCELNATLDQTQLEHLAQSTMLLHQLHQ